MTRPRVVAGLWLACAFVTWNVIFDRLVATSALDFTRTQVVRHQRSEPLASIHDGFTPSIRASAARASLWTLPVVIAGGAAVFLSRRRAR
jgi:hypothetical protein